MNYTNYKITLDMTKIQSQISIPVPQNDTARRIYIRLFHNGKQFALPSGVRVVLAAQKADGTVIYNDCLIEGQSVIRYDFTEQTTSAVGEMKCQLRVYGRNGGLITSPQLTIVVYENIFTAEDIVSSDEFTILNRLITDANVMIYEVEHGLKERVNTLETDVRELAYQPMKILSFFVNVPYAEKGETITSLTYQWTLNRIPEVLYLNDKACAPELLTKTEYSLSVKNDSTFLLRVVDERGRVAQAETTLRFLNGVYYGASAEPSVYDSAFISSLQKKLCETHLSDFTVNPKASEYIYYCLPEAMGEKRFSVGGLNGGFSLVNTIAFTNAHGHTEPYHIYRSDYQSLGETRVAVEEG